MNTERITLEDARDQDTWICVCGNSPHHYGFYPCDSEGHYMEPDHDAWDEIHYACDKCGRIIDQRTLEVTGQRLPDVEGVV